MQITSPMNIATLYSILSLFSTSHAADFNFGFEVGPNDLQTLPGNCGIGGQMGSLCGIGNGIERADPDTTPFYQGEIFIGGQRYWHVIVGDPASGFAMESYTRVASGTAFGSFSGGAPANFGGLSLQSISGNGWDPLGIAGGGVGFTGNGSGDPTKTVFRQVMGDGIWDPQTRMWNCNSGEFCAETLKDRLNFKPIINQTINDSTTSTLMQMQFQLDMSNITYSDNTAAGAIINTLTLTDPSDSDFYLVDGNFDIATDTQAGRSEVTGGRYVYNNCANPSSLYGGSCWQAFSVSGFANIYQEGSYAYSDGSTTDPMAYNWEAFFDPTQNPFSGNKMKCDSSSPPGSCNAFGFPF